MPGETEPPVGAAPAIIRFRLTRYRNYRALDLALSGNPVVLTGPNGAGKTNLLEAVSLLSPGRGLRRAGYGDMGLRPENPSGQTAGVPTSDGRHSGWSITADIARDDHVTVIGTGMETRPAGDADGDPSGLRPGGRIVRIDAVSRPAEAMLEHLRILWLTPAMDRLFSGPPGDRRRFLDRLVMTVDPAHGRRVTSFERQMRNRNRLLADDAEPAWLDATETELAAGAMALARARRQTVTRLSGRIAAHAGDDTGFPAAQLALSGSFEADFSDTGNDDDDAAACADYQTVLRRERSRDRAAGRTLTGPHTSDLTVLFAGKNMPAELSSTGEQKALLIGLVLAHAGLVAQISGLAPVLLLDEVAAHLDANRRAALFARLAAIGGQVFMTGTDAALFDALPDSASRFHVEAGQVTAR
ncbi:MAG: DNA replication/repair protein RecF [Alphaproteobacteria bacterium]